MALLESHLVKDLIKLIHDIMVQSSPMAEMIFSALFLL